MTSPDDLRKSWRELLATLQEIDDRYLGPERHVTSADDIADGQRLVLHVLQSAVDLHLESDPDRPQLLRLLSPRRKHTGDNPDVVYYHAMINAEHDLVIRGKRAGETYLSFTVYGSRDGVWSESIDAEICDREMQFAPDGSYEIHLGRTPKPGNWLCLAPNSFHLVSRHYYAESVPASAELFPRARPVLERVDRRDPLPRKDAAAIHAALGRMNRYLRNMTLEKMAIGGTRMPEWFSRAANTIGPPRLWEQESDGGGNGTANVAYAAGFFSLEPGRALVIEGRMPTCVYASVVLTNRYLQSLDYRERRVCLNHDSMQRDSEGRFRVVVAGEDPGVPNWLHTEGRSHGVVYWRFMLPEGEIESMTCRVVEVAELREEARA